jgi:hypothetical protein
MIETELPGLFMEASADAPPSRLIDVAQAKLDGDRSLRRRRTGLALTAAVTAVAVLVTMAWIGGRRDQAIAPVVAASSSSTTQAVPRRFDPLRLRLAAGWLPAGAWNVSAVTTLHVQQLWYDDGNRSDVTQIVITTYAAGSYPQPSDITKPMPPGGRPGPAIHGAPSTWDAQNTALTWQWAPGAWASVNLEGRFGSAPLEVASRIAVALRTDLDQPVTTPVTMAAPPAPWYLLGADITRGTDGSFRMLLSFSDNDNERIAHRNSGSKYLVVLVAPMRQVSEGPSEAPPNTRLNGHPALAKPDGGDGHVALMDVKGTWVEIDVVDDKELTQVKQDLAVAIALTIEAVSDPSDFSTWTATPIH